MNHINLIKTARGDEPADLLLTDAKIINVFSGEVLNNHIAIKDGYIAGLGDYSAHKTVNLKGKYVAPGLIDAHVHIESAMVCVSEFARAVIPQGTTTVVADPHEIANVDGIAGIGYMLKTSENLPMNVYFTLPSCVPATHMETAGAQLNSEDLKPFLSNDRVVALAEMMNFPGVINGDEDVLKKIEFTFTHHKPADGHSPGLSGKSLSAYLSAGISSDHECTTVDEAMEKLRAGMHIMIREGTGVKNLSALLPIVNLKTAHRIMWCTDDRHPHDICDEGHIDFMIRRAIAAGIDPVTAIRIGTLNPALYFGLSHLGAIAPGKRADLIVLSDLDHFDVKQVYTAGVLAAENNQIKAEIKSDYNVRLPVSMNVDPAALDFSIPAGNGKARVIELVPGQIITRQVLMDTLIEKGLAKADPSRDMLKLAVVERHKGTGNIGKAFVKGFGLKKGALASSVAHDSHNIIVVGVNDADMAAAVKWIAEQGGGLAAACNGKLTATLPLPVAGLMSTQPLHIVRMQIDQMIRAAKEFGCMLPDPFMILSFLALPVIPELKLTDEGLFDVDRFEHVNIYTG
jgi:adenine deaminase